MPVLSDLDLKKISNRLEKKNAGPEFFTQLPRLLRTIASHATLLNKMSIVRLLAVDLEREIADGGSVETWKSTITKDKLDKFIKARLETIYRTNIQTVYNEGAYRRAVELKDEFPYLMYDAVDDSRTRPSHAALDGIILPVEDPFWDTHRGPNGHNCRCGVIALTASQAGKEREGQDRKGVQTTKGELKRIQKGTKESLSGIPSVDKNGKGVAGKPDAGFEQSRKDIEKNLVDRTRERIENLPSNLKKPFKDRLKTIETKTERWYNKNSDKF